MICRALNIISSAVARVNPGLVPVVTLDQPLYALAKQIQWNLPNKFGEKQYVLILGTHRVIQICKGSFKETIFITITHCTLSICIFC